VPHYVQVLPEGLAKVPVGHVVPQELLTEFK